MVSVYQVPKLLSKRVLYILKNLHTNTLKFSYLLTLSHCFIMSIYFHIYSLHRCFGIFRHMKSQEIFINKVLLYYSIFLCVPNQEIFVFVDLNRQCCITRVWSNTTFYEVFRETKTNIYLCWIILLNYETIRDIFV